jgi:hypothetical protein
MKSRTQAAPIRAARPLVGRWSHLVAVLTLLAAACVGKASGPAQETSSVAVSPQTIIDEGEGAAADAEALSAPNESPADDALLNEMAAPPGVAVGAPAPQVPPVDGLPVVPAAAAVDAPNVEPVATHDPCLFPPPPLVRGSSAFRAPLPPSPVWDPPGPKRVGLQAGHWLNEERPPELRGLQHGSSGGGKQEWEVNLDIARRAARMLEAEGVEVDVLPTTVPPRYRAHVFVSIHADGDPAGRARGFKVARPGFSSIPDVDDQLVDALNAAYEAATGLPRDDVHITRRMLYYYAFNSRRYCNAVAPGVPQVIVEAGFLTSAVDRQLLLGNPDAAARGIVDGVMAFLQRSTAR